MPANRAPRERYAADEADVLVYGPWPAGMDNRRRDQELPPEALRNAVNVDISRDGRASLRAGRVLLTAGVVHSLWANDSFLLAVFNNTLTRYTVSPTGVLTGTTVRSGLAANQPVSYIDTTERICYSNGIVTGAIIGGVHTPWGTETPASVPTLAAAANGGLPAGRYQVTTTFVGYLGEESGARQGALVTIVDGQRVDVSNIPQPVNNLVTGIRLYRTLANGTVFYFAAELAVGVTTASLSVSSSLGTELHTQFFSPPPPGQALGYFNGRIYIAQGGVLWFTEPLRYGAVHHEGYILFPRDIDVVAGAATGLYVVSDQHYFLRGKGPEDFDNVAKLPFGAVRGTVARLPYARSHVGSRSTAKLAATKEAGIVWMSDRGLVIADMDGDVRVVSEDTIVMTRAARGATLVRERDGRRMIVSTARGFAESPPVADDFLNAEAVRLAI